MPQQLCRDGQIGDHGQMMLAIVHPPDRAQMQPVALQNEAGKISRQRGRGFDRRHRGLRRLGQHEAFFALPNAHRTVTKILVRGAGNLACQL